tara:strand:+ start:6501 stop:7658 length:1158 start_codon:yes stop_codon:yes gene_type:complete
MATKAALTAEVLGPQVKQMLTSLKNLVGEGEANAPTAGEFQAIINLLDGALGNINEANTELTQIEKVVQSLSSAIDGLLAEITAKTKEFDDLTAKGNNQEAQQVAKEIASLATYIERIKIALTTLKKQLEAQGPNAKKLPANVKALAGKLDLLVKKAQKKSAGVPTEAALAGVKLKPTTPPANKGPNVPTGTPSLAPPKTVPGPKPPENPVLPKPGPNLPASGTSDLLPNPTAAKSIKPGVQAVQAASRLQSGTMKGETSRKGTAKGGKRHRSTRKGMRRRTARLAYSKKRGRGGGDWKCDCTHKVTGQRLTAPVASAALSAKAAAAKVGAQKLANRASMLKKTGMVATRKQIAKASNRLAATRSAASKLATKKRGGKFRRTRKA